MITLCKVLDNTDTSFIYFAKKLKERTNYFKISVILKNEWKKSYFDILNNFIDSHLLDIDFSLGKINDYLSEFLNKNGNEWILLIDSREYISFQDLLNLSKIELKQISYAIPVKVKSILYGSFYYDIRLFYKTFDLHNVSYLSDINIYSNKEYINNRKIFELNKLLFENNNDVNIKYSFSYISYFYGNESQSIKLFNEIINLDKKSLNSIINIAQIYIILGLRDKSLDFINKIKSNNNIINYFLGKLEEDLNLKDKYFKKFLENIIKEEVRTDLLNIKDNELIYDLLLIKDFIKESSLYLVNRVKIFLEKLKYLRIAYFIDPFDEVLEKNLFEFITNEKDFSNPEITIIIPTYSNYDYLIKLIKNLVINTDTKFLIKIIDDGNGSKTFDEFVLKYQFLDLIKNTENLGFVKSVNIGYQNINTPYILILNDDTYITLNSIDKLLDHVKNNNQIAIIGSLQFDLTADIYKKINTDYIDYSLNDKKLMEIPDYINDYFVINLFSKEISNLNSTIKANSVSGYCLLIKSEVAKKVEINSKLLDEIYGFGYYDDFDLCERVKRIGYEIHIAKDVLIKHFGSLSVSKTDKNITRINTRNRRTFFNKWFHENKLKSPILSLCMIVKNEEENLEKCLRSIDSICEEIIIVDTGSTDNTLKIAEKFGANIYFQEWEFNFSLARNESLKYANGECIIWLDADDLIKYSDLVNLKEYILKNNFIVGKMPIICSDTNNEKKILYQYRIFKNNLGIKFKNFIHEYPDIRNFTNSIKEINIPIYHSGYLSKDREVLKEFRNLEIIQKNIYLHKSERNVFLLIKTLMKLSKFEECLIEIEDFFESFKINSDNKIFYYQVYLEYSKLLYYKKDIKKSLKFTFIAIDLFPELASAYLWAAFVFESLELESYSLEYYKKVLDLKPGSFSNTEIDLYQYKVLPLTNIGNIYRKKGLFDIANNYFIKAKEFLN